METVRTLYRLRLPPRSKKCDKTPRTELFLLGVFLWLGLFRLFGWFRFFRSGCGFLGFAWPIFFLLSSSESFLQTDHVFAGSKGLESLRFLAKLFFGVVRGFDRQPDATLDFVDLDHPSFDFLADLENVFHLGDMVLAQLRDVHQTVDVVLQLNERAKAGELADFAFHQIADLVLLIDYFPRIVAQLFDAEADPLICFVDVNDFGFDFVGFLKHFARMIDLPGPAQV